MNKVIGACSLVLSKRDEVVGAWPAATIEIMYIQMTPKLVF
jgi:hypothetical protein